MAREGDRLLIYGKPYTATQIVQIIDSAVPYEAQPRTEPESTRQERLLQASLDSDDADAVFGDIAELAMRDGLRFSPKVTAERRAERIASVRRALPKSRCQKFRSILHHSALQLVYTECFIVVVMIAFASSLPPDRVYVLEKARVAFARTLMQVAHALGLL